MNEPRCPFCLEIVLPLARKCRHCGSNLSQEEKNTEKNQIYVVDKGFLKFAKFALAILAIFFVFGTYVLGFDLKELVKEMREVRAEIAEEQEKLDTARNKLASAEQDLQNARIRLTESHAKLLEAEEKVKRAHERVAESVKSTEGNVVKIRAYLTKAGLLYATLEKYDVRLLTIEQQNRAEEARKQLVSNSESPQKRHENLWPLGQELRVRFIGGTPEQHEDVQTYAKEWEKFANIKFVFGSSAKDAEVRVSFNNDNGSWAFVGTQALGVPSTKPTMNLAWVTRSNVVHEFGHVIGMVHEHQNPKNDIVWDEAIVTKELGGPPTFWSAEQVKRTILTDVSGKNYPGERPYDPLSIMGYEFPDSWIASGSRPKPSDGPSKSDQAYASKLYPG